MERARKKDETLFSPNPPSPSPQYIFKEKTKKISTRYLKSLISYWFLETTSITNTFEKGKFWFLGGFWWRIFRFKNIYFWIFFIFFINAAWNKWDRKINPTHFQVSYETYMTVKDFLFRGDFKGRGGFLKLNLRYSSIISKRKVSYIRKYFFCFFWNFGHNKSGSAIIFSLSKPFKWHFKIFIFEI